MKLTEREKDGIGNIKKINFEKFWVRSFIQSSFKSRLTIFLILYVPISFIIVFLDAYYNFKLLSIIFPFLLIFSILHPVYCRQLLIIKKLAMRIDALEKN